MFFGFANINRKKHRIFQLDPMLIAFPRPYQAAILPEKTGLFQKGLLWHNQFRSFKISSPVTNGPGRTGRCARHSNSGLPKYPALQPGQHRKVVGPAGEPVRSARFPVI